jgi:predicted benzoate:H+ symporter BenE
LIAADGLKAAVIDSLTSGYCPASKSHFLLALLASVAILCGAGFALMAAASRSRDSRRRFVLRTAAVVVILFTVGGAAIDLFGFCGCGSHIEAGLTRDWPW